tara:strand:- start:96 stop:278 length:183 start_codon:yes stop_codon:yes gene_type:complete
VFRFLFFGAGNRVRTGDLNLGKVALYQLSYSRKSVLRLLRSGEIIFLPFSFVNSDLEQSL